MEFGKLNAQFQYAKPVENHSSLIWSERFAAAGDFSRESGDIGGTLLALPIGTIVSLRDSDVPMIVEMHKIEKGIKTAPKITTTGRSFETVLDRRTTIKDTPGGGRVIAPWISTQLTAVDAAYDALRQVVVQDIDPPNPLANPLDKIPELNIKPPIRPYGYVGPTVPQPFSVDPGELYSWVLSHVTSENYGIRAVRPSNLSDNQISIEIYTGEDKTTSVVFDVRFDQFDSSTYLLSDAAWKNVDQVAGAKDSLEVVEQIEYPDGGSYMPSGLDRRVTYYDATSLATGAPSAQLTTIMQNLGTVDLARMLETALFSGEVSRQMGSLYGKDYRLGDVVKLAGDYGLSRFVRVAEFIRSEDNNGEKAYPTFASL